MIVSKSKPFRSAQATSFPAVVSDTRGRCDDCCLYTDSKRQRVAAANDASQMQKFPEDLVYAYLCEVGVILTLGIV